MSNSIKPRIILVGGLPGSGKSPLLAQLCEEGWGIYDDFQARAHGNSSRFHKARRYSELIKALQQGRRCVVSDIRFVCADYRAGAVLALQADVGCVELEWRIFENDPEQCEKNIRRSSTSRPQESRLEKLQEFTRQYSLPQGVAPLPIWR